MSIPMVPAIEKYNELPQVEGPKLHRFRSFRKIEYKELLNEVDDEGAESFRAHSYVFRVLIDSKLFALKIFKFFDVESMRDGLSPYKNSRITDEDIEGHADPFYAECRAFGKINESIKTGRKKPIAVGCHGFLSIPTDKEEFFAKRFGIVDWNQPEDWYDSPTHRQPFRAIVKDFILEDPEATEKTIITMKTELKALNSLKIYVKDISRKNYKGGHIVDFSSAWTHPHFMFRREIQSRDEIKSDKKEDPWFFDDMVEKEFGLQTTVRAVAPPTGKGCMREKLRSNKNYIFA